MWLNDEQVNDRAIDAYRKSLLSTCPNHIVIDHLFNAEKLDNVIRVLQQPHQHQHQHWKTQQHTYSALYVDSEQWHKASNDQRFVQRDVWQRDAASSSIVDSSSVNSNAAHDFLSFLRGHEFMSVLSRIFKVLLTDKNVSEPDINTNYFRLGAADFVEQHADDSPGRQVCMLLYLNKEWNINNGGELVFISKNNQPIKIAPLYNRCVLFDPSSEGSEHWVEKLKPEHTDDYRYNVTSWYWSE
jgi:Rps23 Pro-64 3,4-dihydroxylase Tpa1-like proline 4-hydroxylase